MPRELALIKQARAEFKKRINAAHQIAMRPVSKHSAFCLRADLKEALHLFKVTKNDQVIFDYIDRVDRRDIDYMFILEIP